MHGTTFQTEALEALVHLAGDVGREEHQMRPALTQDGRQGSLDLRRRLEERVGIVSRAHPVKVAHPVEEETIGLRADDDHAGLREVDALHDLPCQLAAVARASREVGRVGLEGEQRPDPDQQPGRPPARSG